MILNIVKVALVGVIILFAYINYDSIDSKMILTETVELRNTAVQKRLTQISDAQVEYKKVRGTYAGSFNDLIDFLKNDSVVQVKMEGEVPDSLLGQEALALELGIIRRDTTKIPVKEILFTDNFNNIVDSMPYIPFAEGKQFTIATSSIEKNKLKMPVFEVKANLKDIYLGLETDNEGYDMSKYLAVGSLEDAKTNGNWN
ncbi:MAG: hypothetical protein HRT73_14395 [Flavobacteriales bacterium]|nr:hypothetical protein [Flavobacteriales bacterium]